MDTERLEALSLLVADLTDRLWRKERRLSGGEIPDQLLTRAWELTRVGQWEVVTVEGDLVGPMTEREAHEYAASSGIVKEVRQIRP